MKKVLLALSVFFASAVAYANTMGIEPYIKARSVKVCGVYKGWGTSCGTGLFVGQNLVLTKAHVLPDHGTRILTDEFGQVVSMSTFPVTLADDPFIMRNGDQGFSMATLVSSSTVDDLALLTTDFDVTPQVLFNNEPLELGQTVVSVGNPTDGDFESTRTKITSFNMFVGEKGPRLMIGVASKKRIRPGYSGGGVFTLGGGLIGNVESCNESQCFVVPTQVIKDFIKENK